MDGNGETTTYFLRNDLVHHPVETNHKKTGCLEFQAQGNIVKMIQA